MSFVDLLRESRVAPTAVLHTFLTTYDPNLPRVHAFVEGEPDEAFYRAFIETYLDTGQRLFVYNCRGKQNVFNAYHKVIARYPQSRKVLFFVDKDVDDLIGKSWPTDPRIFVTDWYSIENYLVHPAAVEQYLKNFVRLKHVTVDPAAAIADFNNTLDDFHRAIRPLMCWVIMSRRTGSRAILSDLKLDDLFRFDGKRTRRRRDVPLITYLSRVTQYTPSHRVWRQLRYVRKEIERVEQPKRYVRGKFEAWFLMAFVKRLIADLTTVSVEAGGNVSVITPLHETNCVPLLVRFIPIPGSLASFLDFHFNVTKQPTQPEMIISKKKGLWQWIARYLTR